MANEITKEIYDELCVYLQNNDRLAPLVYVYGINNQGISQRKDITIRNTNELIRLIKAHNENLNNFLNKEEIIPDFNVLEDYNLFCEKILTAEDHNKTNGFRLASNVDVEIINYIKNKYESPTLIIELQNEGHKIVLFKSIPQSYFLKPKWSFPIKLYREDEPQTVSFLDNKEGIILDEKFEISILLKEGEFEENRNLAFIWKKRKFEDLYNYTAVYDTAYTNMKRNISIINWTGVEVSDQIKKQCYNLEHFDHLQDCLNEIQTELLSPNENQIKKYFTLRGIEFDNANGNFVISPDNKNQLRFILKALNDKVAETCLLKKGVILNQSEDV